MGSPAPAPAGLQSCGTVDAITISIQINQMRITLVDGTMCQSCSHHSIGIPKILSPPLTTNSLSCRACIRPRAAQRHQSLNSLRLDCTCHEMERNHTAKGVIQTMHSQTSGHNGRSAAHAAHTLFHCCQYLSIARSNHIPGSRHHRQLKQLVIVHVCHVDALWQLRAASGPLAAAGAAAPAAPTIPTCCIRPACRCSRPAALATGPLCRFKRQRRLQQ